LFPSFLAWEQSTLPCISLNNQLSANVESHASGENNQLIEKGQSWKKCEGCRGDGQIEVVNEGILQSQSS